MRYVWLQGGVLTRSVDDSAGQPSRIALLIRMYEIYIIDSKTCCGDRWSKEGTSLEQNFDLKV